MTFCNIIHFFTVGDTLNGELNKDFLFHRNQPSPFNSTVRKLDVMIFLQRFP